MATSNVVIDLSHNNSSVDLVSAASDGVLAVIHKATQGTGFVDNMYGARRKAASDAKLLWGAYHFGTGADPVAQANSFLRAATLTATDLAVLDFEENPKGTSMTLDQARTFIKTIQDSAGVTPGLYAGAYLKGLLGANSDPVLGACWLWWAQYGPQPMISSNWPTWTLWQYTDGHHGNPPFEVDGVGPCDRDQYNGSSADLQTKWVTGTLL